MDFEAAVAADLDILRSQDRLRETSTYVGRDRVHLQDESGRDLISFCSNDYLGLASHPALADAASRTAASEAFGAGAARLVAGQSPAHRHLELALARYLGREDVLLFPTGYQTNIGAVTALAGHEDLIVSDAANHASLIDGCRLSRARVLIYPHLDISAARTALTTPGPFRRRILITESLFSMDGDRAPLAALSQLVAATPTAILIVDEAHALGVLGPGGKGLTAETGAAAHVTVGTLGKAFGAHGGFAAGSANLRTLLVNRARTFVYTTASPPSVASAASASLRLIAAPEGAALRSRVAILADRVRARLTGLGWRSPGQDAIIPLLLGTERAALSASSLLRASGIIVPAIRPPTVPDGTARLRLTVSAAHTDDDIETLLDTLERLRKTVA